MATIQLDNRISFFFERLFIPGTELPECEIDILYKENKTRLKYPVKEPLILQLDNCFTTDNKIEILILQRESLTRLKKIAKGQINIYKKYFNYTKKYTVEKWVYLELFNAKRVDVQNNQILQTLSSTGKIFMKAILINPPSEDENSAKFGDNQTVISSKTSNSIYSQAIKNNLKILEKTKENIKANKTEKFRSITENSNDYLRNLKNRKDGLDEYVIEEVNETIKEEVHDGLSDIENDSIDENEEDNHMNLGMATSPEMNFIINKLREMTENQADEIIPKTKEEIKQFIKNVYSQVDSLAYSYNLNINTISEMNKKIKLQAKNYYEKYKEIKTTFTMERSELKSKNSILEYEIALNNEENLKLRSLYNDVKSELLFFRTKLGIKMESDPPKDQDFITLCKLLKEVKNDIDLSILDDQEKTNLNSILNFYNLKEENNQVKSEIINFSDNEYEENNNVLKSQNNKENLQYLVNDIVLLYNKTNKLKENIKFNNLRDDEYDFNGIISKLSLIDSQVLVLDKNNIWISLNEFLTVNFPSIGKHQNTSNKKPKNKNLTTSTSIQCQIEKIKEEKQRLLSSMNSKSQTTSQTTIQRSKSPILNNQK